MTNNLYLKHGIPYYVLDCVFLLFCQHLIKYILLNYIGSEL